MTSIVRGGISRIALAALALTFVAAAAPRASAHDVYPPGWNRPQTPPPSVYQFTPGSSHMHAVPGAAAATDAAASVPHRIIYQWVPGGSRMHAIAQ